jgi:hypothetical protein
LISASFRREIDLANEVSPGTLICMAIIAAAAVMAFWL